MSGPTFDRRLLLLAILPIAVYFLVYAVVDQARPTGIVFSTIEVEPVLSVAVAVAEAKLRYFWLSAFVLLTVAILGFGWASEAAHRPPELGEPSALLSFAWSLRSCVRTSR